MFLEMFELRNLYSATPHFLKHTRTTTKQHKDIMVKYNVNTIY
jgi:hypothetical protein